MTDTDTTVLPLGSAIENIDDPTERTVLALVHHLSPALRDWRDAEDLRARIADNERAITGRRRTVETLRAEVQGAREARDLELGKRSQAMIAIGASAVVVLVSFFFVGWLPAIVLGAIGAGVAYHLRSTHQHRLEACESTLIDLEQRAATESGELDRTMRDTAALVEELGRRSRGFPAVEVADIHFPLVAARIGQHDLLVDLSATHEPVTLHTVDVSELESGMRHIADRAQDLLNVPPMLEPTAASAGSDGDDGGDVLYGQEEELQQLVTDYTVNLGKLRDSRLELPLVAADSPLAARLAQRLSQPGRVASGAAVSDSPGTVERIRSFVDAANGTRERATAVFDELQDVFQRLERACGLYAVARTNSMNSIHENLLDVLGRANWCNRRFYCPRTILSPAYIQELLGIDLDAAHELPLDELLERLADDPVVQRRLETQPMLVTELRDAYTSVQQFAHDAGVDPDAEDGQVTLPTHIEGQLRESRRHLRHVLQKAMTGSAYPVLNFSAEAQLFYDPISGQWASPTTPHTYSTPDVMRFGSMVKAYTDVMMPLWEHLWTEKADFRKSEVFRTNESMIRMSEKESEKLIEIANQFRADMRTVREHVFTLESDMRSKRDEIVGFRDGMAQLGLISEAAMNGLSDERIAEFSDVDFDRGSMDRLETLLTAIPQSQAELRGTVHDPIDGIREPSALLTLRDGVASRLLGGEG